MTYSTKQEIEKELIRLLTDKLPKQDELFKNNPIDQRQILPETTLIDLGLDSLALIELQDDIELIFEIKLDSSDQEIFWSHVTWSKLIDLIYQKINLPARV
ncbi:MAG: acyl carrier protein [Candidatus Buchananbacteria bacterium]